MIKEPTMKKGLLLPLVLSSLFASMSIKERIDYHFALLEKLDHIATTVDGKFYTYDFNHNGHIDYNDWVYESLHTKKRYRLLAHPPTPDNAFGFAPVDVDLSGAKVAGYFKRIDFKGDDPRYSWIYLRESDKKIYKLMGSENGFFVYFDLDGDGNPDPLRMRYFFSPDGKFVNLISTAIKDVAAGWYHTCALRGINLYCWGDNSYGELGDGTLDPILKPCTKIFPGHRLVAVDASKEYTCALEHDATKDKNYLYCWGRNEYGKLGDGKVDKNQIPLSQIPVQYVPFEHEHYSAFPTKVKNESNEDFEGFVQFSAGSWHGCGVTKQSELYCWGQNFSGALGIGKDPNLFSPYAALSHLNDAEFYKTFLWPYPMGVHSSPNDDSTMCDVKMVSVGSSDHNCLLKKDGRVMCWGWNGEEMELGVPGFTQDFATVPFDYVYKENGVLEGIVKIASGMQHTCALRNNGLVYCWGENDRGQLGDLTTQDHPNAVMVRRKTGDPLGSIIDIFTARGNHTCAIDENLSLYCWGANGHGELGIGESGNFKPYAVKVKLDKKVIKATAGGSGQTPFEIIPLDIGEHTCAITLSNELYCWGANSFGQVGDGTKQQRTLPVKIELP